MSKTRPREKMRPQRRGYFSVSGLKPSAKITIECSKILQIPAKKKTRIYTYHIKHHQSQVPKA